MERIKKKIFKLGQTELAKEFEDFKIRDFNYNKYLSQHKLTLNEKYLLFSERYGFGQFNKNVVFKSIDVLSFSFDKHFGEINFIYGWGTGDSSLQEIRETFLEQIPEKYFVFAEGNPGDQICINIEDQKIYYWYHESNENDELNLVANSFEEFITNLSIRKEEEIDDDIEEEWFADDF